MKAIVLLLAALLFSAMAFAAPDGMVNINTAEAAEIAEVLDGVGITRARAIVAYREQFGSFETVDELVDVRGIGQHILDSNKARIVLAD